MSTILPIPAIPDAGALARRNDHGTALPVHARPGPVILPPAVILPREAAWLDPDWAGGDGPGQAQATPEPPARAGLLPKLA